MIKQKGNLMKHIYQLVLLFLVMCQNTSVKSMEVLTDDETILLLEEIEPVDQCAIDLSTLFPVDERAIGHQPTSQEFVDAIIGTTPDGTKVSNGVTLVNGKKISEHIVHKAAEIMQNHEKYDCTKDRDGSIFLVLDYLTAPRKVRHAMACQLYSRRKIFKALTKETQQIVLLNLCRFADIKNEDCVKGGFCTKLALNNMKLDSMDGFSSLPFFNVKEIDLSNNHLRETYLKLFGKFLLLEKLILRSNLIESICQDEVDAAPATLEVLDLTDNNIATFPRMSLQHKEGLNIILDDNPLIGNYESLAHMIDAGQVGRWQRLKSCARIGILGSCLVGSTVGLGLLANSPSWIGTFEPTQQREIIMYYDVYYLFNCFVAWQVGLNYSFNSIAACINQMVRDRVISGDWPAAHVDLFKSFLDIYNKMVYQNNGTRGFGSNLINELSQESCQSSYIQTSTLKYAKKILVDPYAAPFYNLFAQTDVLPSLRRCRSGLAQGNQLNTPFANFSANNINITIPMEPDINSLKVALPTMIVGTCCIFTLYYLINTFCPKCISFYKPCVISAQRTDQEEV